MTARHHARSGRLAGDMLAGTVWEARYRAPGERGVEDTWRRVARSVARAEGGNAQAWRRRFEEVLADFRFIPAGRVLAGAGRRGARTLFNCFVMPPPGDDVAGVMTALREAALTLQHGGGVGYDFSTLSPAGVRQWRCGTIAPGPVACMRLFDAMCAQLFGLRPRPGAMMATLRCDHPDVERFVEAKREPGELRRFNLSVLADDTFMRAVRDDLPWPLVFPLAGLDDDGGTGAVLMRRWSGAREPVQCRVFRTIPARRLWDTITRTAWDCAEPGVLYVDRINEQDNLCYREHISATNPCGEVPLPAYGACDLGSLNLPAFVREPFSGAARLDMEALRASVAVAVRLLDDVIEVSRFPLAAQRREARATRRIGLGITGLADMLILLGLHYGSEAARERAADVMHAVCVAAYRASVALAREKGPFPEFQRDAFLEAPMLRRLPAGLRDAIARDGLRNGHLLAIAPAGTISLLADNVSSGIEPVFRLRHERRVRDADGTPRTHLVEDHAWRLWRELHGTSPAPPSFVDASMLAPEDHLLMQAALQPWVDAAISKTINVPAELGYEAFRDVFTRAHRLGLKGCTVFRPNAVTGEVLASGTCCVPQEPAAAGKA